MVKLFENKTTYTKQMYLDFLKFHNKQYGLRYHIYTATWTILFILCIVICIDNNLRLQTVLMTIFLTSFLLYRIMRPKMVAQNELASDKLTTNNENFFAFFTKHIKVTNKNGIFNYKYFQFRRIFETDKYFYLYISKEDAFIVAKDSFSMGTAEEFSKFIKDKCNLKYKRLEEDV